MSSGPPMQLVITLLARLPYTIVLISAIVLALLHARRMTADPRPAVFMATGAALLLFNTTVVVFLQSWWFSRISGGGGDSIYFAMGIFGFFQSAVSAIGVGLLCAGCLVGRSSSRPTQGP